MCFLSLKKIKGSGEAHKGWVLTVKELKHEHNVEPNAVHIYPEHKRANLGYQKQLAEAAKILDRLVQATMKYIRFQTQPGYSLDRKAFYNTRRITSLQTQT